MSDQKKRHQRKGILQKVKLLVSIVLVEKKTAIFFLFLFIGLFIFKNSFAQKKITKLNTEVLVVGGTASGVTAGIQSARLGVQTLIIEPTTWLGGMITSAGVSAFDGNHLMPSGVFGAFRKQLYTVYGGPKQVETGWVSNTLFEPHVGDSIFKAMAASEKKLKIKYNYNFKATITNGVQVIGAKFIHSNTKNELWVYAKRTIDATELGDVLASAGIPYTIGMESYKETGENVHVPTTNNIIQDITHVAILKNYGSPQQIIERPDHYDSTEFDGATTNFYFDTTRKKPGVNAQKMLDYGKLPHEKYMLNWPIYGNDIYLNLIEQDDKTRAELIEKAKQQTLRFVYFIQKDLGFKNYGLANDEFPTQDKLAFYPYYRESRRVDGVVRMKVQHIATPFETEQALYKTGIAVGDYPIDHHHKKNPAAPQHLDFYPVPSFNIAMGTLLPKGFKNIIIAEKSISVSNVVNGTTRLQPCVMQIGQAAGMLAALSIVQNKQPIEVSVRSLQEKLLSARVYIMPYMDLDPQNPHFIAAQKMGATGLLKGVGTPTGWANKTYFNPTKNVALSEFLVEWNKKFTNKLSNESKMVNQFNNEFMTIEQGIRVASVLSGLSYHEQLATVKNKWASWGFDHWDENRFMQRIELAVLLNEVNIFNIFSVNVKGYNTSSK